MKLSGKVAPITIPGQGIGRAYGFIQCYASQTELLQSLTEAIPHVRSAQGPKDLEVLVTEGINPDHFTSDPALYEIAREAKEYGSIHYVIEARSEMNNYETGLELGTVIAQSAMQHQEWYHKENASRIVYEQDGAYLDIE